MDQKVFEEAKGLESRIQSLRLLRVKMGAYFDGSQLLVDLYFKYNGADNQMRESHVSESCAMDDSDKNFILSAIDSRIEHLESLFKNL
jgi:hypothetical protein